MLYMLSARAQSVLRSVLVLLCVSCASLAQHILQCLESVFPQLVSVGRHVD